jgi:imidazolonepropionase
MKALYINIKDLVQVREEAIEKLSGKEMKELPTIQNAWLLTENGTITDYGKMEDLPKFSNIKATDLEGKIVLPTWCDSHTHLVYAGNREQEFVDRINGLSYEEVAERGGGIVNSAKTLQETSEEDLYQQSAARLEEVIRLGTGAIEIKSGYGLTREAELKMLRVIKRLKQNYTLPIKATFLGAHALPPEYRGKREEYIDLVINEILPEVAKQDLADYIDIFCEKGYFTIEDTNKLLEAGKEYGLKPKIHVNQFNAVGGVKAGVQHNALSVDHLEVMKEEDIDALRGSNTMPVGLPGCSLFIGIPYTPARQLLDAGLTLCHCNRL